MLSSTPLGCGARPGCRCQQCATDGHTGGFSGFAIIAGHSSDPALRPYLQKLTFPSSRLSGRRGRWVKGAAAFGFVVARRPSNECWDEAAAASGRGGPEAAGGRPGRGGPRLLPHHKPPHGRRRGPPRSSRSRRASSRARGVLGEAARRKGRQAAGCARKAGRAAKPERGSGAPPPPGLRPPERSLRGVVTAEPPRGVSPDLTPGARPRRTGWGASRAWSGGQKA